MFFKSNLALNRSIRTHISKCLLLNLSPPKKTVKNLPSLNFGELQIQQSIFFSKTDKRTLLAILNDYETVWGNLEIPFMSWLIFNNFFSLEKTGQNFPRSLIFKLEQEALKFNKICVRWSSQKTYLETNFLKLENWS